MASFSLNQLRPVGNELLDAQHRVILGYLAKLYECVLDGEKGRQLFVRADRLDASCRLHFLEEETMLEQIGFLDLEDHKAQHAAYLAHLVQFTANCEEWGQARCIAELDNLAKAFLEHVETYDQRYAERG